jgi:hypothetical protein
VIWLNVIASNIGSFFLGVLVCKWLGRRAAAAVDHIHDHSEAPVPAQRTALMPLPVRVIVLVLVGSLMFGLGIRVGYQLLEDKVSCFDQYANDLADSLTPRQQATEDLQAADVRVTAAIKVALIPGHDTADKAELQAAIAAKARMQNRLDEQRIANPYPEAPRKVC